MAKRGLRPWRVLALTVLGACAEPSAPVGPSPPQPPPSIAPPPAAPAPTLTVPKPPAVAPPHVSDACGATDLQSLVGRPRTDIPVPVDPSRRRVLCSTCPMSPEYVPYRQTIIYDAQSGLVKEVRCG